MSKAKFSEKKRNLLIDYLKDLVEVMESDSHDSDDINILMKDIVTIQSCIDTLETIEL